MSAIVSPRPASGHAPLPGHSRPGPIPLATGLMGYCPLYHLLHISTNPAKKYG